MFDPADKFIEESVRHPAWLSVLEQGHAEAVVRLASENGYGCSLVDLQQAARRLLGEKNPPSKEVIDEVAGGLSNLAGPEYGDDTGYAALFGAAGAILKL